MFRMFFLLIGGLFPTTLIALFFANPAQPSLQTKGLFKSPTSWYCLRIGYVSDCLYKQKYQDEVDPLGNPSASTKLVTDGSIITLNFGNRFDCNLLVGSSQMQVDREVFTKREFSWSAGAKLLLFQNESFSVALDAKYFESQQKPQFFVSEGLAFNVLSNFKLSYSEIQGGLGIAYRIAWLTPYAYLSYLYSKIDPSPMTVVVKFPLSDASIDIPSRPMVDARRWGTALGVTILGGKEGSLTLETRLFNQNGLTLTGEVRF